MNKRLSLRAVFCLFALAGMGCSNTAEGAKEDTSNAGQAVSEGAQKAADATKKAADNAGQAVSEGAEHAADATKTAADNAGQAISKGAENADAATHHAAKNATAALEVTPRVKTAIVADSQLNDTRNLINVDSANNIVHLKGHVVSEQMQQRAGKIAQKTLTEGHSTDKLSNELTIQP